MAISLLTLSSEKLHLALATSNLLTSNNRSNRVTQEGTEVVIGDQAAEIIVEAIHQRIEATVEIENAREITLV